MKKMLLILTCLLLSAFVNDVLAEKVQAGDTIIFDSVSRMSCNANDGTTTYFDLVDQGVNLLFIREPHINSELLGNSITTASRLMIKI